MQIGNTRQKLSELEVKQTDISH